MSRGRRHSAKRGKNYTWVATVIAQDITTSTTQLNLVSDDDWFGGTGQARATIIAVRGWLSFANQLVAEVALFGYVGVLDEDATSSDPTAADTYVDEDIMLTFGVSSMNEAVAGFDGAQAMLIDIKAKRKIRTGQDLRINMRTDIANGYRVNGVIRTLLLKNAP